MYMIFGSHNILVYHFHLWLDMLRVANNFLLNHTNIIIASYMLKACITLQGLHCVLTTVYRSLSNYVYHYVHTYMHVCNVWV